MNPRRKPRSQPWVWGLSPVFSRSVPFLLSSSRDDPLPLPPSGPVGAGSLDGGGSSPRVVFVSMVLEGL